MSKRAIWIAAAAVVIATQLSGCFFIFIPGSVVGAVSDSITGATGANCVSSTAKVGDRIRLPDGSIKEVKTLSGTSTRCQAATMPIRAELVDVPGSGPDPALARVSINVPPGWFQRAPPASVASARVFEVKDDGKANVAAFVISRANIVDGQAFAEARRSSQLAALKDTTHEEIRHTESGGRDVYRYEVVGEGSDHRRYAYFTTIVMSASAVVVFSGWSEAADRDQQRPYFDVMLETVREGG